MVTAYTGVAAAPFAGEGQVRVSGTQRNEQGELAQLEGLGFVEQYLGGGANSSFRSVLGRVSEVVMRNVGEVCPLEPTHEQLVELVTGKVYLENGPALPYVGPHFCHIFRISFPKKGIQNTHPSPYPPPIPEPLTPFS